MLRTPSRNINPKTNLVSAAGFGGYVQKLEKLLDEIWFDKPEEVSPRIVEAATEYLSALHHRRASKPPRRHQESDVQQIVDTIGELETRLHPIYFPPSALEVLDDAQRSLLDLCRKQLPTLRSAISTIQIPDKGFGTNPGKSERDSIFIKRLLEIYDDVNISLPNRSRGSEADRKRDEELFVEQILECFGEKPPVDLAQLVRTVRK